MAPDILLTNMVLHIDAGEEADEDETDRLTRELCAELRELDVESVELVKEDSIPQGAKSGFPITLGVISLAFLPSLIPNVADILQVWSQRGSNRSVKITTRIGDRPLEIEYSPKTMSRDELMDLLGNLSKALGEQNIQS